MINNKNIESANLQSPQPFSFRSWLALVYGSPGIDSTDNAVLPHLLEMKGTQLFLAVSRSSGMTMNFFFHFGKVNGYTDILKQPRAALSVTAACSAMEILSVTAEYAHPDQSHHIFA